MITIDSRMLDTDGRFYDYCEEHRIVNPFREEMQRFAKRSHQEGKTTVIAPESEEDKKWRTEWVKRRNEYLRLEHTFRLWDFHFWMTRTAFEQHLNWSKEYADTSIYMPCDTVERQCDMACTYFGGECPRMKEELKTPKILGFEGRWEYHDKDDGGIF